ncbi:hypothetical protein NC653_000277 [Populus alba x Populus x berolinensis]|uniref:Selenoprotein O n=1 Tax=Populus alba x Populus x berolinensis TaxID=444605 RepID=A0AAD6WF49_9ROSI|nr:hypothetical protein NC653_000277 [Populus alba x Populus x berolinensis]
MPPLLSHSSSSLSLLRPLFPIKFPFYPPSFLKSQFYPRSPPAHLFKPSLSRHVSTRSFPSIRGSRSSVSMESSSPEPTVSLDSVTQDLKNQTLGPDDVSKAKLKLEDLNWDHSFVRALPGDPRADTIPRQVMHACYTKVLPSAEVENPELVAWSDSVADLFDLDPKEFERPDFPLLFSGASPLVGALPYAQCYGGHQFGMWAGQLGDGRAITLGRLWELQLKGSGRTPYSRFADGLAVLRSSIREFLCSEAMHCLGIPTTRALSLVTTGKYVTLAMQRKNLVLLFAEFAPSFLRFGSYQIHASRGKEDLEIVRALADYAIRHHFPHIENMNKSESLSFSTGDEDHSVVDLTSNKYAAWTVEIAERTASMIASWQGVGFTHGVMNTDNMSILGLTIDYGPFGFLDAFDPSFTPNTTDLPGRRYCFANQPDIGLWNIAQFTATLSTAKLINDKEADYAMERYGNKFMDEYQAMMTRKLGLPKYNKQLINKLLNNMAVDKVDYTNFFRLLSNVKADPKIPEDELLVPLKAVLLDIGQERKVAWISWVQSYVHELAASGISDEQRKAQMDSVNPKYVLRNYLCQTAIDAAEQGDYREVRRLLKLMERPYDEQPGMEKYARLPPAWAYRPAFGVKKSATISEIFLTEGRILDEKSRKRANIARSWETSKTRGLIMLRTNISVAAMDSFSSTNVVLKKQVKGESSVISREDVAVKRIRTEEEQEIANRKPSLIWKGTGGWTAASILLDGCGDGKLSCVPATSMGQAVFYLAIYLVAFGYGGHQPSIATFGADQFDESKPKERNSKAAFFCYFYFALNFGSLFSNTLLVYFEDHGRWTLGFLLSLGSAVIALVSFLFGAPGYKYVKPCGNPLPRVAQVFVAAARKWDVIPVKADELYELEGPESAIKGSRKIFHSEEFEFLDKAATMTEDDLSHQKNPWRLCTITQMASLFVEQGDVMNSNIGKFHLPAASMSAFDICSVLVCTGIYRQILVPLVGRLSAGATEIERLKNVIEGHKVSSLSIFWQIPQYVLVGASEVFMYIGQLEFFNGQAPDGIKSFGSSLCMASISLGNYASSMLVNMVMKITTKGDKPGWIPDDLKHRTHGQNRFGYTVHLQCSLRSATRCTA